MTINPTHLKVAREKSGWSQSRLAAHLGISLNYYGDIEAGRRQLKRNPDLIKRIAAALNVPQSMIESRAPGEVA